MISVKEEEEFYKDLFLKDKEYANDYDAVVKMCNIKESDIFIDLGANLGQEIEYFSKKGVHIESYEPHPYFFWKLHDKYADHKNITVLPVAVCNRTCVSNFFFKKHPSSWGENHSSGGASLERKSNHDPMGSYVRVMCRDIVEVLQRFDKIKILKIDVEGSEYKILRRMIETGLITKPDFIFLEDHQRKIVDLESFLKDKEYVYNYVISNNIKLYKW